MAAEEDEARRRRDENAAVMVEFISGGRVYAVGGVCEGVIICGRYVSDGYKC